LGICAEGTGDLDELLLGHGQVAGHRVRIDRRADAAQKLRGLVAPLTPVDALPESALFEADGDVFGHGQVGKQGRLLVDGSNAETARGDGVVVFNPPAL
jgi:hypothetical protein